MPSRSRLASRAANAGSAASMAACSGERRSTVRDFQRPVRATSSVSETVASSRPISLSARLWGSRNGESGGSASSTRCRSMRIAVRGFRTSWASDAANSPTAASRSRSASSRSVRRRLAVIVLKARATRPTSSSPGSSIRSSSSPFDTASAAATSRSSERVMRRVISAAPSRPASATAASSQVPRCAASSNGPAKGESGAAATRVRGGSLIACRTASQSSPPQPKRRPASRAGSKGRGSRDVPVVASNAPRTMPASVGATPRSPSRPSGSSRASRRPSSREGKR